MKKITYVIIGALLIACGVVYTLNIFGLTDVSFSFNGWWALFIILPCLEGLLTSDNKIGSFIGLSIGVLLLLAAQNVLEYKMAWQIFAAVILLAIGVKLIVKSVAPQNPKNQSACKNQDTESEDASHMAICSEKDVDYFQKELETAKIGAIFGGAKCNFSNAVITFKSRIDILCVFGGAEIIVPKNVTIKSNAFCLFGGISDKRALESSTIANDVITINGFCLFGGADIK